MIVFWNFTEEEEASYLEMIKRFSVALLPPGWLIPNSLIVLQC